MATRCSVVIAALVVFSFCCPSSGLFLLVAAIRLLLLPQLLLRYIVGYIR
jgi:hypothetical protein